MTRKRLKPGPGWSQLKGPVWEHKSGVRIHVSGQLVKIGNDKPMGARDLDALYKMWRSLLKWCVAINGWNKKRGMMVFALIIAEMPPVSMQDSF